MGEGWQADGVPVRASDPSLQQCLCWQHPGAQARSWGQCAWALPAHGHGWCGGWVLPLSRLWAGSWPVAGYPAPALGGPTPTTASPFSESSGRQCHHQECIIPARPSPGPTFPSGSCSLLGLSCGDQAGWPWDKADEVNWAW